MGNQFQTRSLLFLGSVLLKEDATVVHLDGSRMFHPAKLIARQHHHSVFLEGTGDARIALHPFQCLGSLIAHLVELCHLVGIGLTEENTHRTALADGSLLLELTSDEGIKIGGKLADVVTCHRLPPLRHLERGDEDGPEVGLVETRESGACEVWHEEGVHIVFIAVQGLVVRREVQFNLVVALQHRSHGDNDMFIFEDNLCGTTLFLLVPDIAGAVEASCEVEHHILWSLQVEGNNGLALHFLSGIGRDVE